MRFWSRFDVLVYRIPQETKTHKPQGHVLVIKKAPHVDKAVNYVNKVFFGSWIHNM